jgi:multicomponent Na+:H+ antiporter subunit F
VSVTLVSLTLVLTASLVMGLARVARGPAAADRMLAAQLLGTTGVGMLLLLSAALDLPGLIDVGLVFALLAAVAAVMFARRATTAPRRRKDE